MTRKDRIIDAGLVVWGFAALASAFAYMLFGYSWWTPICPCDFYEPGVILAVARWLFIVALHALPILYLVGWSLS